MEFSVPMTTAALQMVDRDAVSGVYPSPMIFGSLELPLVTSSTSRRVVQRSPVQQARHILVRRIMTGFVLPIVGLGNSEEFFEFWNDRFGEVAPLFHSFVQLLDDTEVDDVLPLDGDPVMLIEQRQRSIEDRVIEIGGAEAGSCLHFSTKTMERALSRLRRLMSLPIVSRERQAADRLCAQGFNRANMVYSIALLCLTYVVEEDVRVPPSVLTSILELVRVGAMRSYEHAANGLDVRLGDKRRGTLELQLPFDNETEEELTSLVDEHIEDAAALLKDHG